MKNSILFIKTIIILLFTGNLTAQNATTMAPPSTPTDNQKNITPPAESSATTEELSPEHVKFYFGARYMPTFTNFDVQTFNNGKAETTFTLSHGGGAYIGTNFNKHVGLQLEVMYTQMSQKYVDRGTESRVDMDYINIPLLLTLNTNTNNPVNLNIVVGPQAGINVGSNIEKLTANGNDSITAVLAVKGGDFGIAYGAGLDINVTKSLTIDLGFRGVLGLLDISDDSKTVATNEYLILDKTFVRTYAAYIGLRINIR